MVDEKIVLTYCPNNPKLHNTNVYNRLAEDPRFDLRSPSRKKLCVFCGTNIYAWIGEKRNDGFVFGQTEKAFIESLESQTKADITIYKPEIS